MIFDNPELPGSVVATGGPPMILSTYCVSSSTDQRTV
jgi:hypothetical protein